MPGQKRSTALVSSDEEDDIFSETHDPKPKRKRNDSGSNCPVPDVAEGPPGFITALTESGFHPRSGTLPNLLTLHQTDFQQKLRDHFLASIHYPRNVEFFVADCKTFFGDEANFVKALQPTETPTTSSESPATHLVLPQDSLVRLLLNVEEVQPKLMEFILEQLVKFANQKRSSKNVNIPSLILSQMSWLNRVVNPTHLVDTMLDLLNNSQSTEIQREIISQLPGLVVDQEQVRVAHNLANMIGDNSELTAAIIDSLGDLNLPPYKAAEVRENVVKLLPEIPTESISVLLGFVFKKVNNEEAPILIKHVRAQLDKALKSSRPSVSQKKTSLSDCIKLTVEVLHNSLTRSKILADTWIKAVHSASEAKEHYCIDLVVLTIQHKLTGRRRSVESLLRKKMRSEMWNRELLQDTFRTYSCVLKDYFSELRAMADSLILSRDPIGVASGSLMYREMFQNFDGYYQQEVVIALMQHVGSGDSASVTSPATAAIITLQELAMNRWEDMVQLSSFILSILEYLDYMPLPQVKRVMELLARMAYGYTARDQSKSRWANFSASIRSELSMIIKKQLHHTRAEFQRMGTVGCVALIQCLADTELTGDVNQQLQLSQDDTTSSLNLAAESASNNLPTGEERLKQARKLIDMARSCSAKKPEVAALFMDEMANAVLVYELHPALQSYLYDLVAESFQEQFVVDETDQNFGDLPIEVSLQYGLDTSEENPNVSLVFMNLSPMIIREHLNKNGPGTHRSDSKSTIVTLMSHFRLLRNTINALGDLDDIDALLGCSVCLPSPACTDRLADLTSKEKDLVCRCLFYAVNWFIEVINTFARAKNPAMRTKVIQRLRHIVQLKEILVRCLAQHPNFVPPPSIFSCQPVRSRSHGPVASASTKAAKGKRGAASKRGKSAKKMAAATQATQMKTFLTSTQNDEANGTNLNFTLTGKEADGAGAANRTAVDLHIHKHFREFDLTAFMLLSSPLDLSSGHPEDPSHLQSKELELLLEDLAVKIGHRLVSAAKKRVFPGQMQQGSSDRETFNTLDLYPPEAVAKRCVSLIRRLCPHLEAISGYFQQLLDGTDGILDGPAMFTELALRLGNCYHLLFRSLNSILSWNEFTKAEHQPLLEDALKNLATRIQGTNLTGPNSIEQLSHMAFDYVEQFSSSMPYFSPAVEHVQLLKSILSHQQDDRLRPRLAKMAEGYLKRTWNGADGTADKGSKFNQGVETILQVYLLNGPNVLGRLADVIGTGVLEALESDIVAPAFATCNDQTLSVYYRATFAALNEATQSIAAGPSDNATETLTQWSKSIGLLNQLVSVVKKYNKRSVLTTALKHGRKYVEVFVKSAMPLLDKEFKHHQTSCQNLLKNLQISTRILQHVCTHVKTSREAALAAHVPAMKRTLESLLYRVKAMLSANGCADAFWLGNLKNRNLKGDEIHSQVSEESRDQSRVQSSSEEEEEEEQSQSEESDDDVTVMSGANQGPESEESERESISPDF